MINFGFHFYASMQKFAWVSSCTVGILAILLAFLMLRHCSNNGTVADLKYPPR